MNPIILIVAADTALHTVLTPYLQTNGYTVHVSSTLAAARSILATTPPHCVIVDLDLHHDHVRDSHQDPSQRNQRPRAQHKEKAVQGVKGRMQKIETLGTSDGATGVGGFLTHLHQSYPALPLLILSTPDTILQTILHLRLGPQDHLSKPITPELLLERLRSRLGDHDGTLLTLADLELNSKTVEVRRGGQPIALSPFEFRLLEYFLRHQSQVLTRQTILQAVWQYSSDVPSRVVDVYVGYLRRKLDTVGSTAKLIHSVRGYGYSIHE